MAKRIFLFLITNILVVLTINILLRIFNVQPYLTPYGLDYTSLAAFCFIWGMGGAFISLLLSKIMVKMIMGVKIIDPQTTDPTLQRLVQMISRLSTSAGIPMPEVGIYQSPEVNAFATGPTKNHSLVAVSSGLLQRMDSAEIEGVLGHELSHVANGDMVTMTLLQGIVNSFVMFLSRVISFALVQALRGRDSDSRSASRGMYFLVSFVLEIVFMIFGAMIVAWFSRYREFRADAGGAVVAGRGKMIAALQKLQSFYGLEDKSKQTPAIAALKISSSSGFLRLFSTHPPLSERIARLISGV
ncbi:MAG TPA: protease HtpX [Deltaproteobacteria bacterium]|nr:MAG: zinc metalloprotease HtpX [Deltaproteobacteria bacterium GWA2_45_12]HBF12033.1 protease HtpX [Deltaproteobacteria bacterium]